MVNPVNRQKCIICSLNENNQESNNHDCKTEDIIETIKDILNYAIDGDLSSIAIAYVNKNGTYINNCWTYSNKHLLMSSITKLSHDFINHINKIQKEEFEEE